MTAVYVPVKDSESPWVDSYPDLRNNMLEIGRGKLLTTLTVWQKSTPGRATRFQASTQSQSSLTRGRPDRFSILKVKILSSRFRFHRQPKSTPALAGPRELTWTGLPSPFPEPKLPTTPTCARWLGGNAAEPSGSRALLNGLGRPILQTRSRLKVKVKLPSWIVTWSLPRHSESI